MQHSPLISAAELNAKLQDQSIVLLDVRTQAQAKETYLQAHFKGAIFVDLNTDLSSPTSDPAHGGRHPLPSVESFVQTLSGLGIQANSHVVIYDANSGANAAARAWWMLKAVGVNQVQVLDGGYQAGLDYGLALSSGEEIVERVAPIKASTWNLPLATKSDVKQVLKAQGIVIDVREAGRYHGEFEPIDSVAGHISGAVNRPFAENLDSDGYFLSKEELRAKYKMLFDSKDPSLAIVHCGSGVTACHTLLAMAYAGLELPALYVGSWSEWSRGQDPIG